MRFAVISDIHGNIDALNAVLEDINKRGIEKVYSTGDLVGYMPFTNEVVDRIRDNSIEGILGNHDQVIAEGSKVSLEETMDMDDKNLQASASRIYTNMTITDENRAYLKTLPLAIIIEADGVSIQLTHGSPRGISEYLYEEIGMFEELTETFDENAVITGHTHIPYHRVFEGKHFINAGSVGKPKHGNSNATYIIVDTEDGHIKVDIIEVAYPLNDLIAAIKDSKFISDKLIPMLEEGR